MPSSQMFPQRSFTGSQLPGTLPGPMQPSLGGGDKLKQTTLNFDAIDRNRESSPDKLKLDQTLQLGGLPQSLGTSEFREPDPRNLGGFPMNGLYMGSYGGAPPANYGSPLNR